MANRGDRLDGLFLDVSPSLFQRVLEYILGEYQGEESNLWFRTLEYFGVKTSLKKAPFDLSQRIQLESVRAYHMSISFSDYAWYRLKQPVYGHFYEIIDPEVYCNDLLVPCCGTWGSIRRKDGKVFDEKATYRVSFYLKTKNEEILFCNKITGKRENTSFLVVPR